MAESFINLDSGTAATIQGLNQYTVGITGGWLIDYLVSQIPLGDEDAIAVQIGKQAIQVGLNAFMIKYMLDFIHGATPSRDYRDPTHGYLLMFGLLHGQPQFQRRSKAFTTALQEITSYYATTLMRNSNYAEATDTTTNTK